MKKLHKQRFWWFMGGLFSLLLASCENNPDLNWQPTLVAPLVRGSIDFDNQQALQAISDVLNLQVTAGVPSSPIPLPVPAFSGANTLPEKYSITQPPFAAIGIKELSLSGTITNPFGVAISAGAKIILRNQGEATPFLEIPVTTEIPAKGTYNFEAKIDKGRITRSLEFQIQNFGSPGSNGQPVDMSNNKFGLSFKLGVPKVEYIEFPPNVQDRFENTNNFDLGLDEDIQEVSGTVSIRFSNQMPINLNVKLDLLDANDRIVGTLVTLDIPAGSPSAPSSKTEVISSTEVINQLKNAKKVKATIGYNTNGFTTIIRINSTDKLEFLMSSELKLKIDTK